MKTWSEEEPEFALLLKSFSFLVAVAESTFKDPPTRKGSWTTKKDSKDFDIFF
jgi:hypothetical protein